MNLSRGPKNVRDPVNRRELQSGVWFYEDPAGLMVYHETHNGVGQFLIPRRAIATYMRRLAAPDNQRNRVNEDRR